MDATHPGKLLSQPEAPELPGLLHVVQLCHLVLAPDGQDGAREEVVLHREPDEETGAVRDGVPPQCAVRAEEPAGTAWHARRAGHGTAGTAPVCQGWRARSVWAAAIRAIRAMQSECLGSRVSLARACGVACGIQVARGARYRSGRSCRSVWSSSSVCSSLRRRPALSSKGISAVVSSAVASPLQPRPPARAPRRVCQPAAWR